MTILAILLLFFWWVYRRQRRIERKAAEQERRDNEAIRLATVRLCEQERQMWQEHKDALDRIEKLIDDVLANQDADILNVMRNASEQEQVQYLKGLYERGDEDGR